MKKYNVKISVNLIIPAEDKELAENRAVEILVDDIVGANELERFKFTITEIK